MYFFKYLSITKVTAPRCVLPDGDFAVCVACCNNFFCVLGSSGRVFVSEAENPTVLEEASELRGIKIIEVSGIYEHFSWIKSLWSIGTWRGA